ncbi:PIN domain-like protein [Exidia glandulosa HHB12029]|uniref:PIN domain-like protein n=1 Tax=Exidia glandulosa HHB12029 TaxID=1314781 RepID=A0A165GQP2_EXIGL|nr:PIN domain-like protein [Exidia glandulosa HHB12029]
MGVKGLWKLVGPVGRPVLLESVEGKTMAIDSSIWLYQFQATMRDKDGRALVNAHVVGFLRRICKLLFYGIKPVFVFDGGAPAIKKATITERKKRKSGFAASHAKLAEKILAAQMRREAVTHVKSQMDKTKNPALTEDLVYLEDYDDPNFKSPQKKDKGKEKATSVSPAKKKHKFHDHDPYRLPEVDLEAAVVSATRAAVPDPRLATEDELRDFIENMRPEDFDVTSPAFRELPTEVKYEIIGDLRLKSRQTSYKRLQTMLRSAPTALDFSKAQIKFLQQRNNLTQQLLTTTDNINDAHVHIPVRVASERNRQYVLIKNEGVEGGWVLGRRDDGTMEKPIEIDMDEDQDVDEQDEDDSNDMEEVRFASEGAADPDMRDYRRHLGLSSIGVRQSPEKPIPSRSLSSSRASNAPAKKTQRALFAVSEDESSGESDEDDPNLSAAIAQSLESEKQRRATVAQSPAQRAIANSSRLTLANAINAMAEIPRRTSDPVVASVLVHESDDDDADLYMDARPQTRNPDGHTDSSAITEERWGTSTSTSVTQPSAVASGGDSLGPSTLLQVPMPSGEVSRPPSPTAGSLGVPTLLMPSTPVLVAATDRASKARRPSADVAIAVHKPSVPSPRFISPPDLPVPTEQLHHAPQSRVVVPVTPPVHVAAAEAILSEVTPSAPEPDSDADMDMEEVVPVPHVPKPFARLHRLSPLPRATSAVDIEEDDDMEVVIPAPPSPASDGGTLTSAAALGVSVSAAASSSEEEDDNMEEAEIPAVSRQPPVTDPSSDAVGPETSLVLESPPSSPIPVAPADDDGDVDDHWDAAQEMDPVAEESEFAQFFSQVKGRSLDAVRAEIDVELFELNKAKKAAQRDSDDITQQMISQIQILLRLFGIPYITAPMEAEAQCAALVELELVEGVITDDSDVFLFGTPNLKVFKNMFNQSKTVECFLATDLARELGLERDKLIRLAYLLGSDYVDGLPGVGPVLAMEILEEFPGADGLMKFREWWMKVQSGKDRPKDNKSAFRKRFKKKFKDLHLTDDWPNAVVRDAYYHPTVDTSEEPFKWGLPDLDALQHFLGQELGWQQGKVDDLLLPIIHRMGQRAQTGSTSQQGTLSTFFDISVGTGTYAPRKKQAYASKRLQKIVQDYRKERREKGSATPDPHNRATASPSRGIDGRPEQEHADGANSSGAGPSTQAQSGPNKSKRKRKTPEHSTGPTGKGKKIARGKKRRVAAADEADGSEDEVRGRVTSDVASNRELRPRRPSNVGEEVAGSEEEEDEEHAFIRRRRR